MQGESLAWLVRATSHEKERDLHSDVKVLWLYSCLSEFWSKVSNNYTFPFAENSEKLLGLKIEVKKEKPIFTIQLNTFDFSVQM